MVAQKQMMRILLWIGSAIVVSFVNPLYAETAAAVATSTPSVNIWSTGGQVLLVLVLVIALLFLLTWFLKRSGLAHQAANGHLKVLGGVSVGPRERVLLLQVGQDQILVGVTSSEISLLHMLSQPVSVDEAKKETFATGFAQQLQTFIRRSESS